MTGGRVGALPSPEDPEGRQPVEAGGRAGTGHGAAAPAVGRAHDGQARPSQLVNLGQGRGLIEEVMVPPAQPALVEATTPGRVALPAAGFPAGLGHVGDEDLADAVEAGTGLVHEDVQLGAQGGGVGDSVQGEVQAVVVVEDVVVRHDAVEGGLSGGLADLLHPAGAVVGVPHAGLEVAGVGVPLDQVAVVTPGEPAAASGLAVGQPGGAHGVRLEVSRGGQAPVGQDRHVRSCLLEAGCCLGLPGLEDGRPVVGDREVQLPGLERVAVTDPGSDAAGAAPHAPPWSVRVTVCLPAPP